MSHFNDQAAEWDSESKVKLMAELARKTIDVLQLTHPLAIMDFGCGTGLFGLELADYAKSLVGIDTSEGMLEVFDRKTTGHDHIRSLNIDLESNTIDERFDLIVSSMAFHHLNDPGAMIRTLQSLLNPGGRLAIVDLDEEDGSFHADPKGMGVRHFGFNKATVEQWAKDANMKVTHRLIHAVDKNDQRYEQFLAVFS